MPRAQLLLSKSKLINNVKALHDFTGKRIIAVIKSNAYGMGALNVARVLEPLEEIDSFAVACVEEGAVLREAGIKKDILILGGILEEEVKYLKKYRLTPVISDLYHLKVIGSEDIKFHVKYDTGMGRLGFLEDIVRDPRVEGVMSHLSTPADREFSKEQIERFRNIVGRYGGGKKIHIESSAGIIYKVPFTTHIRVGLALYGERPIRDFPLKLEPAVSVKARIISIKEVPEGFPISYGRTFITPKRMRIGVVAFGYADGLMKSLSNKGAMIYEEKKVQILGNITMDMTVIDLTDTKAQVGEWVYIVNPEQTFLDISKLAGTIPYEIMCNVGERVSREVV